MAKGFEPRDILVADYAADEISGKYTLAGVYNGVLHFSSEPKKWPPLFIAVIVKPLQADFDIVVRILRPDGKPFLKYSTGASTDETDTPSSDRVIFFARVPDTPFTGFGVYRVLVGDDDDNLEEIGTFEIQQLGPESKASAALESEAVRGDNEQASRPQGARLSDKPVKPKRARK